jgi:hypothetical protein
VNLAYIISAYKLPEQLVRLVRRLDFEGATFFVHVDRKTHDSLYRRMVTPLRLSPNIHFLPRHRCDYGGFGHVRATLKGLTELVRRNRLFDYAILLTGQDYPIKSVDEIDHFFRQSEGRSFLEFFPLPHAEWAHGGMDRVEYRHFRFRGRYFRLRRRTRTTFELRFPSLRLFGGSAYWCRSRECCEYICRFLREQPTYGRFFKYVNVPDEIFFQTILLNSPLRDSLVNDDLRFLEWRNPETAGGPAVLGKQDFGQIIRSSKLFARKFDVTQDAEILDLLDARTTDD